MTSTLTKAKETVARRSRLEIVDEAISADEAKLATALRQSVELVEAEDAAVREAKRRDPSANPYGLRQPAQVARAEAEKVERTISGLERGLKALRADRVVAAAEQAARELAARTEEAKELVQQERAARLAAAETLSTLAAKWNVLADVLSKKSALVSAVAGEQLIERVGILDRKTTAAWEANAGYIVTPVATTFAAFVDELLEAATADRVDVEAEYAEIDAQNERRRELAKRDPGGRDDHPMIPYPVIPTDPLDELVPDLRDEVAQAEVPGVETRRSRPDPAGC